MIRHTARAVTSRVLGVRPPPPRGARTLFGFSSAGGGKRRLLLPKPKPKPHPARAALKSRFGGAANIAEILLAMCALNAAFSMVVHKKLAQDAAEAARKAAARADALIARVRDPTWVSALVGQLRAVPGTKSAGCSECRRGESLLYAGDDDGAVADAVDDVLVAAEIAAAKRVEEADQ